MAQKKKDGALMKRQGRDGCQREIVRGREKKRRKGTEGREGEVTEEKKNGAAEKSACDAEKPSN